MDLSFSRRVARRDRKVDLGSLLATIGAAQAAGATAQAQHRLAARGKADQDGDPRVELFSENPQGSAADCGIASFAPSFSLRQPK